MIDHRSGASPLAQAAAPEGRNSFARDLLDAMLAEAISAADPARVLSKHLPPRPAGRCIVVGAGKAAASMAAALEAAWPDVGLSGVVTTPYGYGLTCQKIRVIEAGHPVPDGQSVVAAQAVMEAVAGLSQDDLVIALISGGGSAALCLPAAGLTLDDKQVTNRLLLASGLDIRTMNAVRRRISAIKGGKLAAAAQPAQVWTLAISDIPGDDVTAIASGPTALDPTANLDLSDVIARLGPQLPQAVRDMLRRPGSQASGAEHTRFATIATPAQSLTAAARVAEARGVRPVILGDAIEGESAVVAREMALLVRGVEQPCVFISGGETTVTFDGTTAGRGGRNTEFALSLACALQGNADVWALAADTDGEDGANLGAAGAIVDPQTLERTRALGLDPADALNRHDSGGLFGQLGDLVRTGPTLTNVNDFRAILVLPR